MSDRWAEIKERLLRGDGMNWADRQWLVTRIDKLTAKLLRGDPLNWEDRECLVLRIEEH